MANKCRALTIDVMNSSLKSKDTERGFSMRIHYTSWMFRRQYSIVMFDPCDMEFGRSIDFRYLKDAVEVARKLDRACEKSQRFAVKEATTR